MELFVIIIVCTLGIAQVSPRPGDPAADATGEARREADASVRPMKNGSRNYKTENDESAEDLNKMDEDANQMDKDANEMNEDANEMNKDANEMDKDANKKNKDANKMNEDANKMNLDANKMNMDANKMNVDEKEMEKDAKEMDEDANEMDKDANDMVDKAFEMDKKANKMDENSNKMDEVVMDMDEKAIKMDNEVNRMDEWVKEKDCCQTSDCSEYEGTKMMTIYGQECLPWREDVIRKMKKNGMSKAPKNYCRNPSGHATAWCYTTPTNPDSDSNWENCEMIKCTGGLILPYKAELPKAVVDRCPNRWSNYRCYEERRIGCSSGKCWRSCDIDELGCSDQYCYVTSETDCSELGDHPCEQASRQPCDHPRNERPSVIGTLHTPCPKEFVGEYCDLWTKRSHGCSMRKHTNRHIRGMRCWRSCESEKNCNMEKKWCWSVIPCDDGRGHDFCLYYNYLGCDL